MTPDDSPTPESDAPSPSTPGPSDNPSETAAEPSAARGDGATYALGSGAPPGWNEPGPVHVVEPPKAKRRRKRPQSKWSAFAALMGCNTIVFVSNVCIMVLELCAARLIAKHVGNSLYTWTSVIGVVLAGITVGNYLGGWLADRFSPSKMLSWLFLAASVLSASVLGLDLLVSGIERGSLSWQWWVLSIVAGIFFVPSVSLGTISPVVAALALSRNRKTGITVGSVYAWGALGSIVGTFLTGFFLIDHFGTRQVVWMTAGTLAITSVVVAGSQHVLRAVVCFGWLQLLFFVGLAASADEETMQGVGRGVGQALSAFANQRTADRRVAGWERFFGNLALDLHALGTTLQLRDDALDEYHDESNYSYVNVGWTTADGDAVKYLRLDKLVHSYWNPANPTKLYYDYEQIYASVTERAAAQWPRTTRVELAGSTAIDTEALPDWVRHDQDENALTINGAMTSRRRSDLLRSTPSGEFFEAVETLHRRTMALEFGGFVTTPLDELPDGLSIPDPLRQAVVFDPSLDQLKAFDRIDDDAFAALVEAAPDAAFYRAVDELYAESRRTSTLFIGGGGFVFPRWIEAKFPRDPRIDVAEIDPAVKRAVQEEMGLPPDDQTAIHTFLGDARNYVDDRLRENRRRRAEGRPPILYDFVYGDAFNDFSVPWHLTTREFTQKVRELLSPQGVYLVNVIEIYPRTVYPGERVGKAQTDMPPGELPPELFPGTVPTEWTPAEPPYGKLQARRRDDGGFDVRYQGVMRDSTFLDLQVYERYEEFEDFAVAIREIHDWSQEFDVPFAGRVPPALAGQVTADDTWQSCGAELEGFELREVTAGEYVLGVRGVMTDDLRDALLERADGNDAFGEAVRALHARSREVERGGFLGRYLATLAAVFPNVYVYSSQPGVPHGDRDTFVLVASNQPLGLQEPPEDDPHWSGVPFAWSETDEDGQKHADGQFLALLGLSEGHVLTDDYAPVDNLLVPVFTTQDD